MRIVDLGLIDYEEAEALQLRRLDEVLDGGEDTLYLLEHPRVITLGRQGGMENLLLGESFLRGRGVALARTTRGGNITCHFPGQLVGYPIFRVDKRPGGLKRFFHDMEEAVIRTTARFGVPSRRREGYPGVWLDERRKICSMGIGVRRWVTYHGLALNIGPDVSLFRMITLCGIAGAEPTSLSIETGREVAVEEVKHVLAEEFRAVFADSAVAAGDAAQG